MSLRKLRDVESFGVHSHCSSGQYEVMIEEYEGEQYRFEFGFSQLLQLAVLAKALVPDDYT